MKDNTTFGGNLPINSEYSPTERGHHVEVTHWLDDKSNRGRERIDECILQYIWFYYPSNILYISRAICRSSAKYSNVIAMDTVWYRGNKS